MSYPTENALRIIFPPAPNVMGRFFLLDENAGARRRDSPLQGNAMYRGSPPKENTKGWESSAFSYGLGDRGKSKALLFLVKKIHLGDSHLLRNLHRRVSPIQRKKNDNTFRDKKTLSNTNSHI